MFQLFNVLVTSQIAESALDKLKQIANVEVWEQEEMLNGERLKEMIQGKDAVLSTVVNEMKDEIIRSANQLKIIANCAVGFNNIDVASAEKNGIVVTNTPDVLTDATADLTWALILGITRKVVEGDRFVREGNFTGWLPHLFIGNMVYGKKLGILGMGRIGEAVAKRAQGFDMDVFYYKRNPLSLDEEQKLNVHYLEKEDILRHCDIISVNAPLTEETYHMIGQKELNLMKEDAYLINTSRGALVDEEALYAHLKEGKIKGAALDVYEKEPHIVEGLLSLNNTILLPHIGSATIETRTKMAELAVENIMNVLQGFAPITPVTKG